MSCHSGYDCCSVLLPSVFACKFIITPSVYNFFQCFRHALHVLLIYLIDVGKVAGLIANWTCWDPVNSYPNVFHFCEFSRRLSGFRRKACSVKNDFQNAEIAWLVSCLCCPRLVHAACVEVYVFVVSCLWQLPFVPFPCVILLLCSLQFFKLISVCYTSRLTRQNRTSQNGKQILLCLFSTQGSLCCSEDLSENPSAICHVPSGHCLPFVPFRK